MAETIRKSREETLQILDELRLLDDDFMTMVFDGNIEVQQSDSGADVHRARFNSTMLDVRMLKAGQKFSELSESYVIFSSEIL